MRDVSAPEEVVLEGRVATPHLKIEVQNELDAWIDYSSFLGTDWQERCEIRQDVEQRIAQATFGLAREADGNSIAPLMNEAIAPGRLCRVSGARAAVGASPTLQLLFEGRIDRVAWGANPLECVARDLSGELVDRWIKDETEYGEAEGQPIEEVIQAILDDWVPGWTLYTPVTPGFLIEPYKQQKQSVMEAIQALADLIGWVIEYRWDNGTGAFRLTFYTPDRDPASTLWTFTKDDYYDGVDLDEDSVDVRNVIRISYRDAATGARTSLEVQDDDSLDRYDEQWAEFEEGDDSPIDTEDEALALAAAALSDLAWPLAQQAVTTDLFTPIQLGDFYLFEANGDHYGADQSFAVTGWTHLWENGKATTRIQTRGSPVGHVQGWIKREETRRPPTEVAAAVELQNFRFVYDLDAVPPTLTIRWDRGDLVDTIWVWDRQETQPVSDNPWPDPATVLPDEMLEVGTDEWVTDVPEHDERGFIQLQTRDAQGFPRWLRKLDIPPAAISTPDDFEDASIGVSALRLSVQSYSLSNPNAFSATDYNTVGWLAVTLHTAAADYSISSGNTGNMSAGTPYYIYFDPAISTTSFQVTTSVAAATAEDVILICIAYPKADTSQEAFFLPGVGILGGLGEEHISANLAAFNILAANTVTAVLMNVGSLSAITADLGTVTAGTVSTNVLIAAQKFTAAHARMLGDFKINCTGVDDTNETFYFLASGLAGAAKMVLKDQLFRNGGNIYGTNAFLVLNSDGGGILIGDVGAGDKVGFYGATPVAQQTGVPVTAADIHGALVNLGLITA